jgi:hypothetical protein
VYSFKAPDDTMEPRWKAGDTVPFKKEPPKSLPSYVMLEMQSGAILLRELTAKQRHTITVQQIRPHQVQTIRKADVKAIHRMISLDEWLT